MEQQLVVIDYARLTQAIAEGFERAFDKVRGLTGTDDKLWGVKEIAAYTGKSEYEVRNTVITQPDFPKGVRDNPKARAKKFFSSEVVLWLKRQQEKN